MGNLWLVATGSDQKPTCNDLEYKVAILLEISTP